jgi:hypothetical protein
MEKCFYCSEEKSVLIERPSKKIIEGETIISFSQVQTHPMICLECFKTDLEAYGVDVETEMGI